MTDTVRSAAPGSPAPGWYADPGGSGGRRWWNGLGWTESVQLPAPAAPLAPVAPAAAAAPPAPVLAARVAVPPVAVSPAAVSAVAVLPVAVAPITASPPAPSVTAVAIAPATTSYPPTGAPVSRFGGPAGDTVTPGPAAPASHRSPPAPQPALSRGLVIGLVAGLIASLGIGVFVWSRGSGGTVTADTAGPRGPASVAAAKLDALSLASAEETFFTDNQKYLAAGMTPAVVALGPVLVHLSATDSASVVLDPAGVGYCITVVSHSATSSAASTVVYVSTAGGLQSSVVTTCPASF